MIALVLATTLWGDFSAGRAFAILKRDGADVTCAQDDSRGSQLVLQALSNEPRLVLIKAYGCACFAQNCPFWVYRLRGSAAVNVLSDVALTVTVIPRRGDLVPDIDSIAHQSATLQNESRYRYANGSYAVVETWIHYGGERKATAPIPVHFAPGASSTRLRGTIADSWGDDYTLDAAKGQWIEISDVTAERTTIVRVSGANFSRVLSNGRAVQLPATGRYHVTVDLAEMGPEGYFAYGFILSIRSR